MDPDIFLPFSHKASQLQYLRALPPSLKALLQPFKLPQQRHSLGPHSQEVTPQPPCDHFLLRCTRELHRPKQTNMFTKCNTHTHKNMVRTQMWRNVGFPSLSLTFMPICTPQPPSESGTCPCRTTHKYLVCSYTTFCNTVLIRQTKFTMHPTQIITPVKFFICPSKTNNV